MTTTQDTPHADALARRRQVSLTVDGMSCGACAARIEQKLNELDGVEATVNFATQLARVSIDAGVPVERVVDQIRAVGYDAAEVVEPSALLAHDPAEVDRQVRSIGRRLAVAGLLFMPLCDASIAFSLVPSLRFAHWQWILLALAAPVVTWCAWPFYRAAWRGLRHGTLTMDTLVSMGILSSTAWSLYAMFWRDTSSVPHSPLFVLAHQSGGAIYLDVAAGVTTFLLAGRYFEAVSRRRTGSALRSLAAVGAKEVSVLDDDGHEHRVPVGALRVGSRFVVRPGETVATDGEVLAGEAGIDRSAMTGESVPGDAGPGDAVVGGTVALGGRLVVRATKVGGDTQLAQMLRLVEDAQNEKADVQRLADRIAGVFVPAVLVLAALTLAGWLLFGGSPEEAFNATLSVLIIACPCALGLATPAALMVASGEGARLGIFFKGYQALEASRRVDTVVLDKTGTVTSGQMSVEDVLSSPGVDRRVLLGLAGSLEQASEHPVGRAVVDAARREAGALAPVEDFAALPGLGARGVVDGHRVVVGRAELLRRFGPVPEAVTARADQWEAAGRTAVLVMMDDSVIGALGLSDTVRPSAAPMVRQLEAMGLHCVLLTGDNEATARAVGAAIGVDDVVAGALPAGKVAAIARLQGEGRSVAMVGDGVNDGPSLVRADLGLAVGSGTDVAINAADLVIVRDDLRIVATAVQLARRTIGTIRGNLTWAFAYNLVALPLAACGLLNPLIAGAAMALSSGFVVWNSARLRHFSAAARLPAPAGPVEAATVAAEGPEPRGGVVPSPVAGGGA